MKVTEYAAVCPRCGAKSPAERSWKSRGLLKRAFGFAFGGAPSGGGRQSRRAPSVS
jgi:hypothetical protein